MIYGMEIIRKIERIETDRRDRPLLPVRIEKSGEAVITVMSW